MSSGSAEHSLSWRICSPLWMTCGPGREDRCARLCLRSFLCLPGRGNWEPPLRSKHRPVLPQPADVCGSRSADSLAQLDLE